MRPEKKARRKEEERLAGLAIERDMERIRSGKEKTYTMEEVIEHIKQWEIAERKEMLHNKFSRPSANRAKRFAIYKKEEDDGITF